jgi:SAM-dependent methyltransferase
MSLARRLDRLLSRFPAWRRLRADERLRGALGFEPTIWERRVADEQVRRLLAPLRPETLSALEVSGGVWAAHGFRAYRSTSFPDFDLAGEPLSERFDLVIVEHVLEHLPRPGAAARNALRMLEPGGHLLVVTPFLYRVHPDPDDCTRWTESGLRHFLAENGFPFETIVTGSWGNRAIVRTALSRDFVLFNRYLHRLDHEPEAPLVVWALARAPGG